MSSFYNILKVFFLWLLILSIFLSVNFNKSEIFAEGFSIISTSLYIRFISPDGDISTSNFIKIGTENNVDLGGNDKSLIVFNHTSNDMWGVNIAFREGFVEGIEVDPVSNFMLSSFSTCENIEFSNGSEGVFLQESISSITLLSSSKNSPPFCYWYLEGIEMKNILNNDGKGFTMILSVL